MENLSQALLVGVVFLNLYLLGSSSLTGCVGVVGLQGWCLGLLTLVLHAGGVSPRILGLAVGITALKGWLIPNVLMRAIRNAQVRREVEPFVGFGVSMLTGVVLIGVAFGLSERLPLPGGLLSPLVVPVSLATVMMGLFLAISRVKAVNQVLGYLVLENGIYLFGLTVAYEMPWVVEMGVLLDVFVGVFIMGIVIHHISREFDSISTERLTQLQE